MVLIMLLVAPRASPASIIQSLADADITQELIAFWEDRSNFEPPILLRAGITMDTFSAQTESIFEAAPAVTAGLKLSSASVSVIGVPASSILFRLARLPMNPAAWLVAIGPWIWSVVLWKIRPRRRRRVRRYGV